MRYPAYPAYKPAGRDWLGDIPTHWNVKRARFCMSVNPPAELRDRLDLDDEVSFIPMDAVGEYGGLRLDTTRPLADVGAGYTEFQDGDVVVAKITPCFENGKGSLAEGLFNGVAYGTTELHVLRTGAELNARFLFYLTMSALYRGAGKAHMYGAGGQKRVPQEFVRDFRTPLPPVDEQQLIAEFLDARTTQIESLVAKKRELLERLEQKRIALISAAVANGPLTHDTTDGTSANPAPKKTRNVWLGEMPARWRTTRLKYAAAKIVDCPHETPVYSPDGEYVVLRTSDLYPGRLDLDGAYRVDEEEYLRRVRRERVVREDILYSREGERWGNAASAPAVPTVCLGQRMMQFRAAPNTDPRYLMWHLNSLSVHNQGALDIAGATTPHVNVETIKNFVLAEPPLCEQRSIASYLDHETSKLDALAKKVEAAIARLREYRSALITAAVTGKIDVRSFATSSPKLDDATAA